MLTILSGVGFPLTLAVFPCSALKFPKGSEAMSGMANAAVAFPGRSSTKYITGDLWVLHSSVKLAQPQAASAALQQAMVPICMGANPVFAAVGGLACGGYGILPGFIAGYIIGLVSHTLKNICRSGPDPRALTVAPLARLAAFVVDPAVNSVLTMIGVPFPQQQNSPHW